MRIKKILDFDVEPKKVTFLDRTFEVGYCCDLCGKTLDRDRVVLDSDGAMCPDCAEGQRQDRIEAIIGLGRNEADRLAEVLAEMREDLRHALKVKNPMVSNATMADVVEQITNLLQDLKE